MTTRAGIYGRNSKGEAKSIADQLGLGRKAVDRQGWTLAGEYSDDSSASRYRTKERDDWARLLADLGAGLLNVLVFWNSSRGSRDPIDWLVMLATCRERGVVIHVLADERTYDPRIARDWKSLAEDGISSAYYSEELAKNIRRGIVDSAVNGGVHGRTPYGYERRYDERTGKLLEQVEGALAPIVREVFARLAARCPLNELLRDLNSRGLPAPSGREWRRNTLRTLATNIAYIGLRLHVTYDDQKREVDRQVYPARWPALVDEDVFWRVQGILNEPERKPGPGSSKPGAVNYLLSYLVTASCGKPLKNVSTPKAGHSHRYACDGCGCTSIVRPDLDEAVAQIIVARLERPDARAAFTVDGAAVRDARAEASRLRAQLEEARRSFEQPDGISADALARKERSLTPLITDADRRARESSGVVGDLIDAPDVRAAWDAMPVAAQRAVVGQVATIVLGPPSRRLTRHATQPERLEMALNRMAASRWRGDRLTWAEHWAAENSPVA